MANYTSITSDKNKSTALILCIFGGFLGLHQFYVGNIKKGLIYMFTMGFFGVGWFFDIIWILLGVFKDNTGTPLRATKRQNNAPTKVEVINKEVIHKTVNEDDYITKIEKLAKLKEQGIITEDEFNKKKNELLN